MNTVTCPSFESPPVVETALSIQFDELADFRTTHFGQFHLLVKDRYPVAVDASRLPPTSESFPMVPQMRQIRFANADGAPERVWLRDSEDGCAMLQVQPDRFGFNWCRQEGQPYPRYSANKPQLVEDYDQFQRFCHDSMLGDLMPNLCEVTYVNHISPTEDESASECFAAVFTGIQWNSSDGWLPQPPDILTLNRVYTIGDQVGRLYVEASTAHNPSKTDFILLKITARVTNGPNDDVMSNIDIAHEWVVRGFRSLTNDTIRKKRWGEEL